MSMTICALCHGIFDTDVDPECWVGPDEDIPVCETCREEEASYENVAHPVKAPITHLTKLVTSAASITDTANDLEDIWQEEGAS